MAGKAVLASSPSPRPISTASADQLLELDRTLDELAAQDEALEISLSTVKRDWQFSRAWLYTRLKGPAAMSSDLSIQELEAVFPAHSP